MKKEPQPKANKSHSKPNTYRRKTTLKCSLKFIQWGDDKYFLTFRTGIFSDSPFNTVIPAPSRVYYLDFHKPFHCLNLCLTEGTTVLGTDISSHCQVGRFIRCLFRNKRTKLSSSYLFLQLHHYKLNFTAKLLDLLIKSVCSWNCNQIVI